MNLFFGIYKLQFEDIVLYIYNAIAKRILYLYFGLICTQTKHTLKIIGLLLIIFGLIDINEVSEQTVCEP